MINLCCQQLECMITFCQNLLLQEIALSRYSLKFHSLNDQLVLPITLDMCLPQVAGYHPLYRPQLAFVRMIVMQVSKSRIEPGRWGSPGHSLCLQTNLFFFYGKHKSKNMMKTIINSRAMVEISLTPAICAHGRTTSMHSSTSTDHQCSCKNVCSSQTVNIFMHYFPFEMWCIGVVFGGF